jgi:PTK7 protein tyrosine kinase 7
MLFHLFIVIRIIILFVFHRFDIAPEGTIQAIEMNQIAFHCVASGDPKPTIKWDKDLEYFQYNNTEDDRFQILQNGTLLISEVHLDDEGKYGCTIGNSAGLKREEIRLVVKGKQCCLQ